MTARAETFDRSVVMSSLMPSLKYSCSASPLMLANGRTQIETRGVVAGEGAATGALRSAKSGDAGINLRHPVARIALPPLRSAHWIWLNGNGGIVPSSVT